MAVPSGSLSEKKEKIEGTQRYRPEHGLGPGTEHESTISWDKQNTMSIVLVLSDAYKKIF